MATTYDPANALAPTPPMGWNSYNAFGGMHGLPADADPSLPGGVALCENMILATADALVATGMRDAGYVYLNLDDRWQDPRQPRDPVGRLRCDERRFPHGIGWLTEQVHARGLRFGIYTVANCLACGGEEGDGPGGIPRTGSLGHETIDAELFAEWGVDFLKIDWCGVDEAGNHGRAAEVFSTWNEAIQRTGRPIVLSASTWGQEHEETWAPRLAHMWRTTDDLHPTWESIRQVSLLNSAECWRSICGPATGWNDPDMMHVGHPGLTYDESRTHLLLWAMMSAPLIAGNDLRTMSDSIRALLVSPEVIAIDQDSSPPATVTVSDDDWDVWERGLTDGRVATVIVNSSDYSRPIPDRLRSGQEDALNGSDDTTWIPPHGAWLCIAQHDG